MDDEIILGIDLGTTNSMASRFNADKNSPKTIRNFATGSEIFPSILGIDPNTKEMLFGDAAESIIEQYGKDYFVSEVKRKMGSGEIIKFANKELTPLEISSLLLKKIKEYSEEKLNRKINRAVITVPANFNDKQRRETIKAGELAGFKVERIINEPTAAALAYGINNTESNYVMVYDLGGGTFDVTILEYDGEVLDVKASAGDNELGGKDFDEALFNYVKNAFYEENNVKFKDKNDYTVLKACRKAKEELSYKKLTTIYPKVETNNGEIIPWKMSLTRAKFESTIKEMINNTKKAINKALKDSELDKDQIDSIMLVGGSTRIPYVKDYVEKIMGKKPETSVDPDRAVSLGAAVQAGIIAGDTDTIIMDSCPFSLGTEIITQINGRMVGGVYSEIMEENTPFLKECTKKYVTSYDNQKKVEVSVYQRSNMEKSIWVKDHIFLDSQLLEGIPANDAGKESITVKFLYNPNGILDVSAKIDSTGEGIDFQTEVQKNIDKISAKNIDKIWKNSENAKEVKATIMAAENKIDEIDGNKKIEKKVEDLKKAVVKGDKDLITKLDDELTDMLFDLEE